jgi:hypothetical protein
MLRKFIVSLLVPALAIVLGISANAGGVLESIDITGNVPSVLPGQVVARNIGMKWDLRSIPVQYRVNNTQNLQRIPLYYRRCLRRYGCPVPGPYGHCNT